MPCSAAIQAPICQTSCHANPTCEATPRCTKPLLRSRQHISQTTRCQSRRIYKGMRNDSRCQVHQCFLSHNRKRVSGRVNQDMIYSLGPLRSTSKNPTAIGHADQSKRHPSAHVELNAQKMTIAIAKLQAIPATSSNQGCP